MTAEPARRLFTVDEFHRMRQAGILGEDDRVELVAGEVVEMTPIGSRHAACVKRIVSTLSAGSPARWILSVQDPVRLDPRTELQPDVALLRPCDDFYARAHPGPGDVLLVIEVADTSAETDREVKLPLYAGAGVPEAWIVDLPAQVVEVHRKPSRATYRTTERFQPGDPGIPVPGSGITLDPADVLAPGR